LQSRTQKGATTYGVEMVTGRHDKKNLVQKRKDLRGPKTMRELVRCG